LILPRRSAPAGLFIVRDLRSTRTIPDRDAWVAALAIVKRYKDDAMLEAAAR